MIVMIVGPIDYWWNENWKTKQHITYKAWRDYVNTRLVEGGHLVYRPHEAFKGAWNELAQKVNDAAIAIADVLVDVTPPGVPAYGTAAEIELARRLGKPIRHAPPHDASNITDLILPLKDPYGAVHRKSYSKKEST